MGVGGGIWRYGLGFRVWGLGFGVQGSGFRVYGLGFRVDATRHPFGLCRSARLWYGGAAVVDGTKP